MIPENNSFLQVFLFRYLGSKWNAKSAEKCTKNFIFVEVFSFQDFWKEIRQMRSHRKILCIHVYNDMSTGHLFFC